MRCQIFRNDDIIKLEQSINIWLKSYEDKIKISRILQSPSGYDTLITIWYYDHEVKEVKKSRPKFEGVEII